MENLINDNVIVTPPGTISGRAANMSHAIVVGLLQTKMQAAEMVSALHDALMRVHVIFSPDLETAIANSRDDADMERNIRENFSEQASVREAYGLTFSDEGARQKPATVTVDEVNSRHPQELQQVAALVERIGAAINETPQDINVVSSALVSILSDSIVEGMKMTGQDVEVSMGKAFAGIKMLVDANLEKLHAERS